MKIDLYGKLKMNDNGEDIIDRINLTKVVNYPPLIEVGDCKL